MVDISNAVKKANNSLRAAIESDVKSAGLWVKSAAEFLTCYGAGNDNYFLLANVPQAREQLNAKFSKEEIKSFKDTLKEMRSTVESIAEEKKHSNPRQCWQRLFKYMRIESGLAHFKHLTKDKNPTEKCNAAFVTISKNFEESEYSEEIKELINDTIILLQRANQLKSTDT